MYLIDILFKRLKISVFIFSVQLMYVVSVLQGPNVHIYFVKLNVVLK